MVLRQHGGTVPEVIITDTGSYSDIVFGLLHLLGRQYRPQLANLPELLGVQPYKVQQSLIAGVELPCRPCSKFGQAACPLGHFKCMYDIDEESIVNFTNY